MQETRRQRLQAVILEELSTVIPREVKDPRIPAITFTSVEVTPDGGQATVYVTLLGSGTLVGENPPEPGQDAEATARREAAVHQRKVKECLTGLHSASGYLRRHLAKILTVRHIPSLIFKEDRGYENTVRVQELLKKISSEQQ